MKLHRKEGKVKGTANERSQSCWTESLLKAGLTCDPRDFLLPKNSGDDIVFIIFSWKPLN